MRSELPVDVLEHQPWHVVAKDVGVDAIRDRADVGLVRAFQRFQRIVRLPHAIEVEPGVVLAALQRGDDALGRRLRRAPRQRRHRDVENIGAGLDRRHVSHRRHAAGAVRVHIDRDLHRLLQRGDQLPGRLGAQQARRVFDDDLVAAHVGKALRERAPAFDVVRRRDRVAERSLHALFRLQHSCDGGLHVAKVVERIENAEHIDPAAGGVFDE